jgi:hypothetical protein
LESQIQSLQMPATERDDDYAWEVGQASACQKKFEKTG